MTAKNDLIGKKIGYISVLKLIGSSKWGKKIYLCECDCGNLPEIIGSSLISGNTKSCGCHRKNMRIKNLKNKKFCRLLVIDHTQKRTINGNVIWKCLCDCGNITESSSSSLIRGDKKSCGCLHNEILNSNKTDENNANWKGGVKKKNIPLYDTYAHQIDFVEEVRRNSYDENILQVKCKYCGKWHTPKRTGVTSRIKALSYMGFGEYNFYCSSECKQECPIFNKTEIQYLKENSPNYIKKQMSREVQPELRQMVFERDNYTCLKCKSKKSLHCHHKEGIRWEPLQSADVDMCITVCKKCHMKIHKIPGCTYQDMQCNIGDV